MDATIRFSCTQCGKCCHNLRLPLSLSETAGWLNRGGNVQIFCEAIPWPQEPAAGNLQARHKRDRSFAAVSGDLPIRVVVSVVASFDGPCPHLLPNMRCGAYDVRPLVCRIYPAEVNPFIELAPTSKACPPEAWAVDQPVFWAAGKAVDLVTVRASEQLRTIDFHEAPIRARLCSLLGIANAALANEGFVIHSVKREALLAALSRINMDAVSDLDRSDWEFVTSKASTRETLLEIGARVVDRDAVSPTGSMEYLAF
ncbi:YkgJ family cysteine cluster protein [Paraburkholderia bengalensis]|uniref:YkgJ family cysteine cluster protein n=1 Tax=Paraburkholderia bengalensis TaxID=2747562 RepID=A0ABU8IYD9_9BURK